MEKTKDILDWTTNSSVYNKARKRRLEANGEISCSRCGYHRGENDRRHWYGVSNFLNEEFDKPKHPSWKLVSKKRKQWMKDSLKLETDYHTSWNGKVIEFLVYKF